MIEITQTLSIDEGDLQFAFIRASGPGGQNVNKVATAVQLRFDVAASALPADVKERLVKLAGKRITDDGVLIIEAKSQRTQEQNREAAISRLVEWIRKAAEPPKLRKKTRPSKAAMLQRLETKKKRGAIKRERQVRAFE